MKKISEILRQRYELKRSYRDIGRSLNISNSTIFDYLARAKLANITWPLASELSEKALYDKLFLPVSQTVADRPLPDWEYVIKESRKKGVTRRLLWREYRDAHPNGLSYSQFCDRLSKYKKTLECATKAPTC